MLAQSQRNCSDVEQRIPVFRNESNYAIGTILLKTTLNNLRPNPFHTQSLLFKDRIQWFWTLGRLGRADSGVNVIHLTAY
jgi:hypothetical protein